MARRIVMFGWAESVHIQRWCAGLLKSDSQIKLISLGGQPLPGVETVVFPRQGRLSYLRHASAAAREARAFKPDLVHVHYATGFGHWGVRTGLEPLLVSVWGSDILVSAQQFWYQPLIRRTLRRAAAITATSRHLLEATVALLPKIAPRCEIIPFGVDLPDRVTPLPESPLRILYLKKHRDIYGPDILLRAVATARNQESDISLTMAGDGPMTESLISLAADLGLADCVRFPGAIPHDQVYQLIAEHHLLAMPSRSESFGVAALEAAACGRPTIASRVGGVPEVIDDGRSGLLVAPESIEELARAIVSLAKDRRKLETMGEQARQLVESRFRWEQSLDQMVSLYDRLLA